MRALWLFILFVAITNGQSQDQKGTNNLLVKSNSARGSVYHKRMSPNDRAHSPFSVPVDRQKQHELIQRFEGELLRDAKILEKIPDMIFFEITGKLKNNRYNIKTDAEVVDSFWGDDPEPYTPMIDDPEKGGRRILSFDEQIKRLERVELAWQMANLEVDVDGQLKTFIELKDETDPDSRDALRHYKQMGKIAQAGVGLGMFALGLGLDPISGAAEIAGAVFEGIYHAVSVAKAVQSEDNSKAMNLLTKYLETRESAEAAFMNVKEWIDAGTTADRIVAMLNTIGGMHDQSDNIKQSAKLLKAKVMKTDAFKKRVQEIEGGMTFQSYEYQGENDETLLNDADDLTAFVLENYPDKKKPKIKRMMSWLGKKWKKVRPHGTKEKKHKPYEVEKIKALDIAGKGIWRGVKEHRTGLAIAVTGFVVTMACFPPAGVAGVVLATTGLVISGVTKAAKGIYATWKEKKLVQLNNNIEKGLADEVSEEAGAKAVLSIDGFQFDFNRMGKDIQDRLLFMMSFDSKRIGYKAVDFTANAVYGVANAEKAKIEEQQRQKAKSTQTAKAFSIAENMLFDDADYYDSDLYAFDDVHFYDDDEFDAHGRYDGYRGHNGREGVYTAGAIDDEWADWAQPAHGIDFGRAQMYNELLIGAAVLVGVVIFLCAIVCCAGLTIVGYIGQKYVFKTKQRGFEPVDLEEEEDSV